MDYQKLSLEAHELNGGKLEITSKFPLENKDDLAIAYTPGVAAPCLAIAKDKSLVKKLTWRKNTIAVISDGSAVLGLGNIGPEAAIPVMEGKCLLFKHFAGIDAVPIVIGTQDVEEFISTVKNLAPSFSGINLEDISAPRCFEIEKRLQAELEIPVFHDDQHGTSVVVLAALLNAAKVVNKELSDLKVILNGAGAAGNATFNLITAAGVRDIIVCDSQGIIHKGRSDLNPAKIEMLKITNRENLSGQLADAVKDRDVFLGVSAANVLTSEMVKTMAKDPIIIAMANPIPEIMPDLAKAAGAKVVATGRSDFPNQVNNVLGFPGIFKGLLTKDKLVVDTEMKIRIAKALAALVAEPTADKIIPGPFEKGVVEAVAGAI